MLLTCNSVSIGDLLLLSGSVGCLRGGKLWTRASVTTTLHCLNAHMAVAFVHLLPALPLVLHLCLEPVDILGTLISAGLQMTHPWLSRALLQGSPLPLGNPQLCLLGVGVLGCGGRLS
jgi:hypothetical protein